jgi:hypothetical protein
MNHNRADCFCDPGTMMALRCLFGIFMPSPLFTSAVSIRLLQVHGVESLPFISRVARQVHRSEIRQLRDLDSGQKCAPIQEWPK